MRISGKFSPVQELWWDPINYWRLLNSVMGTLVLSAFGIISARERSRGNLIFTWYSDIEFVWWSCRANDWQSRISPNTRLNTADRDKEGPISWVFKIDVLDQIIHFLDPTSSPSWLHPSPRPFNDSHGIVSDGQLGYIGPDWVEMRAGLQSNSRDTLTTENWELRGELSRVESSMRDISYVGCHP